MHSIACTLHIPLHDINISIETIHTVCACRTFSTTQHAYVRLVYMELLSYVVNDNNQTSKDLEHVYLLGRQNNMLYSINCQLLQQVTFWITNLCTFRYMCSSLQLSCLQTPLVYCQCIAQQVSINTQNH